MERAVRPPTAVGFRSFVHARLCTAGLGLNSRRRSRFHCKQREAGFQRREAVLRNHVPEQVQVAVALLERQLGLHQHLHALDAAHVLGRHPRRRLGLVLAFGRALGCVRIEGVQVHPALKRGHHRSLIVTVCKVRAPGRVLLSVRLIAVVPPSTASAALFGHEVASHVGIVVPV